MNKVHIQTSIQKSLHKRLYSGNDIWVWVKTDYKRWEKMEFKANTIYCILKKTDKN